MSYLRGRARIIREVRRFFDERDFLEVETPLRIPAPAPEQHIAPQPSGRWFLQTSPELCMKRLLARGYSHIYQICKCFRRGERGRRHLPEFTMLEWYRAGADYRVLMEDCQALLRAVASSLAPAVAEDNPYRPPPLVLPLAHGGERVVDFSLPFERLSVVEAFYFYAGMDAREALSRGCFDQLLVEKIEPRLGFERPLFLYDYPVELAALARRKPDNPELAERFELYVGGVELANGFSELTDQGEQRRRFEEERRAIRAAGRRPPPMPESFLAELPEMPPSAGIALGLDRLVMLMLGAGHIDEILAFPPVTTR